MPIFGGNFLFKIWPKLAPGPTPSDALMPNPCISTESIFIVEKHCAENFLICLICLFLYSDKPAPSKAGFSLIRRPEMGPPLKLQNQRSENKTQMAFGISHQGQLLQQVSSNSVDPYFQHLDHFLSQGHLTDCLRLNRRLNNNFLKELSKDVFGRLSRLHSL